MAEELALRRRGNWSRCCGLYALAEQEGQEKVRLTLCVVCGVCSLGVLVISTTGTYSNYSCNKNIAC